MAEQKLAVLSDPPIQVVSLAIPPFMESDPELWFMHLEAEFANNRITGDTPKFNQLLSKVPREISTQLRDILLSLTPDNRYEPLKEALIKRLRPTERTRMQQLFYGIQLGNRSAVSLLSDMLQLLGGSTLDEGILREMWLQRLPVNVQAILMTAKSQPLHEAAQLADAVMERFGQGTSLPAPPAQSPSYPASVPIPPSISTVAPAAPTPDTNVVMAEIAALRRDFQQLALNQRRGGFRNRSPRRRSRSRPRGTVCWYHERYGTAARRCTKPCSFVAPESGNFPAGP